MVERLRVELPNLFSKEQFKVNFEKQELIIIKKRFEETLFSIYDDAKRKHENISTGAMPLWGWAVIAYTGYDDIYRLLTSYMLLPIVLIGITLYLASFTKYFRPINTAIYFIQDILFTVFRGRKKFT